MQYSKYLFASWAVVILFTGIFLGYEFGYVAGSDELGLKKIMASVKNSDSTGDALSMSGTDPGKSTNFASFWKTWQILSEKFSPVGLPEDFAISGEKRVASAIAGLVASYDDPYTIFIPKEKVSEFKQMVNAEFEGIGAALSERANSIVVTGLFENSPAKNSGMMIGDYILSVDGISTLGANVIGVVSKIRGPKGSVVTIAVARQGNPKEIFLTITRDAIALPTTATSVLSRIQENTNNAGIAAMKTLNLAKDETLKKLANIVHPSVKETEEKKDNFFVLQLASFSKTSTDAFIRDLKKFSDSKIENLIIDLRNNPGGYIDVAVDLASYFLPKDAVIVREKIGKTNAERVHASLGYPLLQQNLSSMKLAVIMNKNSASASEIFAGALQDYAVGKIVGEQSFGKGSVQELFEVGDSGSLKVTIARWFTPHGKNISGTGISPDFLVVPTDSKYASSSDPYLDAAIDALLK